jgi:hypothetical protein
MRPRGARSAVGPGQHGPAGEVPFIADRGNSDQGVAMGWWEKDSKRWQMALVAQVGAALDLGAGLFFFSFKSPDLPVQPMFLGIAGGVGEGGSIGGAATIPYSSVIRQLINPKAAIDPDSAMYSDVNLDDSFSCQDLNHSRVVVGQATASGAIVGASLAYVTCATTHFFLGTERHLFDCGLHIPSSLPQLGKALLDAPHIQGGFGFGIFGFMGVLQYIGSG